MVDLTDVRSPAYMLFPVCCGILHGMGLSCLVIGICLTTALFVMTTHGGMMPSVAQMVFPALYFLASLVCAVWWWILTPGVTR